MTRRFLIAAAAAAALTSGSAVAASPSGELVPGSGAVGGHGYGYWVATAWRWRVSLPNVTTDKTHCWSAGQTGPIWFLGGSGVKGNTVTRTCRVPAGRDLMLFVPSVECSTVEAAPFHATTDPGLERCVRKWWREHWGGEELTLDGAAIKPPGYVGGTGVFSFTMPADDNFLGVPGRTGGRAAVYGAAAILRPLSPGTHTLVLIDSFSRPTVVNTSIYKLTVG